MYERHKELGAVFGASYGWEVPLWFAPEGVTAGDQPSFRRTNWFDHVGNECRALRERSLILAKIIRIFCLIVATAGDSGFLMRIGFFC